MVLLAAVSAVGCGPRQRFLEWPQFLADKSFLLLRAVGTTVEAHAYDLTEGPPVIELDHASDEKTAVLIYASTLGALALSRGLLALAAPDTVFRTPLPPGGRLFELDAETPSFQARAAVPEWIKAINLKTDDPCDDPPLVQEPLGMLVGGGMQLAVALDAEHAVFATTTTGFVVTTTSVTPIEPPPPRPYAGVLGPRGEVYVGTATEVLVTRIEHGHWTVESRIARVPDQDNPVTLYVDEDSRVFELTQGGSLRRYAQGVWTNLASFTPLLTGGGGLIRKLSDGRLVAVGCSSSSALFFEGDTPVIRQLVPDGNGICSIELDPRFGLVVGTSQGQIRAERLDFKPIPEVPTHEQRGSAVRALRLTKKGRLFYSGHSGTMGEVLDQGVLCKFAQHGTWTARTLTPLGDQLIASGHTLDYAPMQVDLTRILGVE